MHHIRPAFLKVALTAGLLLWASLSVTPASAASVTYKFAGTVDLVPSILDPIFSTSLPSNNTMTGSLTYNDSPLDSPPAIDVSPLDNGIGSYSGVITDLTITFNSGYVATLGTVFLTPNQIAIVNDLTGVITPGEINDQYFASAPMTGANVNASALTGFQISADYNPSAFDSDALVPPTLANLVTGSSSRFQLFFLDGNTNRFITLAGNVTSITPVPLPPAAILFGAGLLALVGLGVRNWQQKQSSL